MKKIFSLIISILLVASSLHLSGCDLNQEENMNKTTMYVMTETSPFMMSYVIVTKKGNCVIIDGGRPLDVKLLREKVQGKKIVAWFLTHPHLDHISAFNHLVAREDPDFKFDKVYYNFPDSSFVSKDRNEDLQTQKDFNKIFPLIKDKAQVVHTGDIIKIDELTIEILYHYDSKYNFVQPTVNDTSIAFRLTTPNTSVMFLGDLGPEAGDVLALKGKEKLQSEYCQMAHHGHAGVEKAVYELINPRVCIWNAPEWLYEEEGVEQDYRRYGTKRTRQWMEELGVTEHIVTKDGTAEIIL